MSSPLLHIEGLRFAWTPGRPVLDIPELRLERGEHLFLRGPSGSGKSTLLNLIGGVMVAQGGSIVIDGENLGRMSAAARDRFRAERIGFVFQMFNLLPYLNAIENVMLALDFAPQRRRRAALEGDLAAQARALLERLQLAPEALSSRGAGALSVGQQQRVAAARALFGGPSLVIADEPTSALDSDARKAFLDLLFAECRRAHSALLFVSHDRSLETSFDRSLDLSSINQVVH